MERASSRSARRLRSLAAHIAAPPAARQQSTGAATATLQAGVAAVVKTVVGVGGAALGAHVAHQVGKHGLAESWSKSLRRKGTAFRLTEAGRWAGIRSGLIHFSYVRLAIAEAPANPLRLSPPLSTPPPFGRRFNRAGERLPAY